MFELRADKVAAGGYWAVDGVRKGVVDERAFTIGFTPYYLSPPRTIGLLSLSMLPPI